MIEAFESQLSQGVRYPLRLEVVPPTRLSGNEFLIFSDTRLHQDGSLIEYDAVGADRFYTTSRGYLLQSEARLANVERFGVEGSDISALNNNFVSIEGRNVEEWVEQFEKADVLEIGGGIGQAVAIELLSSHSNIGTYTSLEPRKLSDESTQRLAEFTQFQRMKAGISQMEEALEGKKFDVIMAHYVAEHLPNPYVLLQNGLSHLNTGGVLFINRIPILYKAIDRFTETFAKQGVDIYSDIENPPETEWSKKAKQGIVLLNVGIKLNIDEVKVPIREVVVFTPNTKLTSFDFVLAA